MKLGRHTIGLKLGIMLLCMVSFPTLALGILAYVTFQKEINTSSVTELGIIAHDWREITQTYIQQEERVLKREETLVEVRLKSIALHVNNLLKAESNDSTTISEHTHAIIDSIDLGRSGRVFLLDSKDNFIQFGDHTDGKKRFINAQDIEGTDITAEILEKSRELRNGQTYTARYQWLEDGFEEPRKQLVVFSYSKEFDVVIGALSYYSDFQSTDLRWILQDELRTIMSQQKIKENGYVWAVNSDGDYLVSKDKLRDGENIYNVQDRNGNYIIRDLIAGATTGEVGENYIANYAWKDIGEDNPNEQLTVATYVPKWDWIIGVSAYEKDYLKALTSIEWYIYLVSILAIVAGSIASYIFSQYITRPLKALQKAAVEMRDGNLDNSIVISSHDEVGLLANDLEVMRQQLKSRNENLKETNLSLTQLSADLTTKNKVVENMNKFMVDREIKMIELKKQIRDLQSGTKS